MYFSIELSSGIDNYVAAYIILKNKKQKIALFVYLLIKNIILFSKNKI